MKFTYSELVSILADIGKKCTDERERQAVLQTIHMIKDTVILIAQSRRKKEALEVMLTSSNNYKKPELPLLSGGGVEDEFNWGFESAN